MGEQARGQSHALREQCEKLSSPSSDINKWRSTTTFPVNINSFMVSWTALSNWWTEPSFSQAAGSPYISVMDTNNGLGDRLQVNLVWNATTAISNPNDKNTTLCDCSWNVRHSTHGTYFFLMMRSENYVLEDLLKFQRLYGHCMPWTPLYMLFQSALAMYSLLNMIKSVLASQNISSHCLKPFTSSH